MGNVLVTGSVQSCGSVVPWLVTVVVAAEWHAGHRSKYHRFDQRYDFDLRVVLVVSVPGSHPTLRRRRSAWNRCVREVFTAILLA
jgi:hypothetical protein